MIRCVIVDDEQLAIDVIKKHATAVGNISVEQTFTDPVSAFGYLRQHTIDLLFLDIQMPGITGFELLRAGKNIPPVILTTAFREFALEAYNYNVVDYLVKPISLERFEKAIRKFLKEKTVENVEPTHEAPRFTYFKVDKVMTKVLLSDILYAESLKNYVRIHTTNKSIITYNTLGYLEDKLPSNIFQRIHKSYLINLNHVDIITSETVEIGSKTLPIGDSFKTAFRQKIETRGFRI